MYSIRIPAPRPRWPLRFLLGVVLLFASPATGVGQQGSAGAAARTGLPPVETVAALRADADGDVLPDRLGERVRVRGTIISWRRGTGRESDLINFQDSTGGLVLFRADTLLFANLVPGDRVEAVGELAHDDGMEEVRVERLDRLGRGEPPAPIPATTARLRTEELAGRLVRVKGRVELTRGNGLLLEISDSTGSIPVYFRRELLEDERFSEQLFSARSAEIVGIASQSTSGPVYDDGYDIVLRSADDIDLVLPPPFGLLGIMVALIVLVVLAQVASWRRRDAERRARHLLDLARDLENREGILRAVAFAAERFLGADDLDDQIRDALDRILAATGARSAAVLEAAPEEGPGAFRPRVARTRIPPDDPVEQVGERAPTAPVGWAIEPVLAVHWSEELRHGRVVGGPGSPETRLLVPVFTADRWWGALGLQGVGAGWSDAGIEALKAAASIIGAAVARRGAETTLRQREEELRHAQKLEAVGRLAGGIAHDFNNLLTAIGGHADLVSEAEGLRDGERESAVEVVRTVQRASRLTRQLLAFSRKQPSPRQPVELSAAVRDLQPMIERLLGEQVRLEVHARGPAWTEIAPGHLEQVIINLAVNGRDAMPEGGTLRIETEAASAEDGMIRLLVSDSGVGMDEETAERVFEPFFTTKPFGEGTGLGLSTVYGIVAQAGGAISLRSAPGQGAAFAIRLPALSLPPAIAPEAAAGEPAAAEPVAVRAGLVLVVEDEAAVLALVKKVLERAGYRVLAAEDAESALQRLEETGVEPDLLLTDVRMPGMDGPTLAEAVRKRVPGCAVLFMSGYAEQELPLAELGPDALIEKPFAPAVVLDRVQRALRVAYSGDAGTAWPPGLPRDRP